MSCSGGYTEHTRRLYELRRQLSEEASSWIEERLQVQADDKEVVLLRMSDLPDRLRSCMVEMSNSKALEMSQDIPALCSLAAKVALILYGRESESLKLYENDIYYYRSFPSTEKLVLEYDRFKVDLGSRPENKVED